MQIYGLTGGIASGKSTVARTFAQLGAAVVDADRLARDVVVPGSEALTEITQRFGSRVLQEDGNLDRKALGAIVFADHEAREALNRIIHPRIAVAGQEAIAEHAKAGATTVLYEAALIVENGLHKSMQGLIVVSLPEPMQVARLMSRDGMKRAEAESRIASQLPLADKVLAADYVIDNSGAPEETHRQVVKVWDALVAKAQASADA